jgi:DNA-binding transcriptional ArsR family regulator
MISLEVQPQDLANVRFAYSPLVELAASYKELRSGYLGPLQAWGDEARRSLADTALPHMDAMILAHSYMADFLTPTPTTNETDIEREFDRMRRTPVSVIRQNVENTIMVAGESPIRRQFLAYPYESMECLIEEMRLYWSRTLAYHWPRIVTVLENDILFRARDLATDGVQSLFVNLNPIVSYSSTAIRLDKMYRCHPDAFMTGAESDFSVSLEGRGLQLVPVIFGCSTVSWQVEPQWTPMLIYGARGAGLWYSAAQPDPEQSLQVLLGSGRAKLLLALQSPAHTGELASRLSVTAGAVSQQLAKLNEAGLVDSHRSSHKVYYRLTPRGEQLLALFAS